MFTVHCDLNQEEIWLRAYSFLSRNLVVSVFVINLDYFRLKKFKSLKTTWIWWKWQLFILIASEIKRETLVLAGFPSNNTTWSTLERPSNNCQTSVWMCFFLNDFCINKTIHFAYFDIIKKNRQEKACLYKISDHLASRRPAVYQANKKLLSQSYTLQFLFLNMLEKVFEKVPNLRVNYDPGWRRAPALTIEIQPFLSLIYISCFSGRYFRTLRIDKVQQSRLLLFPTKK